MTRTIMSLSGCCAVVAVSLIAAADAPVTDLGRSPLTAAELIQTEPDFIALRAQADAAIRLLIETRTGDSAI